MDLGGIDTRRYFTAIALFLALLFTILAPAGSTDGAAPLRFLQWLLQVSLPLLILIGVHLALSRNSTFDRWNPWLKLAGSGLVGSLVFAPLGLGLDIMLGVDPWPGLDRADRLGAMLADEIAGVLPPIMLVWLGINAPRVLRLDFSRAVPAAPHSPSTSTTDDTPAPATGFLAQVPADLGRDIVYLMAELHYLRVVTTRGQCLVLYNLRDAIDELPAGTGVQTHRSYWAALTHIQRMTTRGGKTALTLHGDHTIPVSRRRASATKAAVAQYRERQQHSTVG